MLKSCPDCGSNLSVVDAITFCVNPTCDYEKTVQATLKFNSEQDEDAWTCEHFFMGDIDKEEELE